MKDFNFLTQIPLFSSLEDKDLAKLHELWTPLVKEEGQVLFKKGDPGNAMYIVESGEIAITVWTEDNQQTVLSVLGEGDFFGELSMFEGAPRSANAKAMRQSKLLELKREDFSQFLLTRPSVTLTMMTIIANRLRSANELIEKTTTKNVNVEIELHKTFPDRLADGIAKIIGSWTFITTFICLLTAWVLVNALQIFFQPFDPYPFTFLNLMLSCVAAIQAPIIMMSQNRQSKIDRLTAELEFQINRKAELQIQSLHVKLDELRASEIQDIVNFNKEEIALLKQELENLRGKS